MQIEYSFLHSRVARRLFVLFTVCALLPVGIFVLLWLGVETNRLTRQAEQRIHQETKAIGMAVLQRLLSLESKLLSTMAQQKMGLSEQPGESPPQVPSSLSGFVGMAFVSEDGAVQVFLGELQSTPALSAAQWTLLRQNKTLLTVESRGTEGVRFFLSRFSEFDGRFVVAELNSERLWDVNSHSTLSAGTTVCVFGRAEEVLFCSHPVSPTLTQQWHRERNKAVFEWHDEQDVYLAGSWPIPLQLQFSADPWTVVLSEPGVSSLELLSGNDFRFSLAVVIAVFAVALLSVMQIRKIMVPLERLEEGTRRVAARNFSTPVQVESGDEFEALATSFNAMASRLHQQFTQLATMHEIDRSVLSVLDPSLIVDTVLARLREVSPCEGTAVLLVDPSDAARGWLYTRIGSASAQTSMVGVAVQETARHRLMTIQGSATLTGQEAAGLFGPLYGAGVASLVVLPLFRSRELLGGIGLSYRRGPSMSEDHLAQLRQVADQVAVALSNASDLAERKRAETSLRESHARLEQAMTDLQTAQQQMVQQERLRALGQMASGIAHDFNNTLSPIMGFSELLLIAPHMSADPVQLKEYLQTINMAAKDAAKVVSRLREFYRPRLDADLAGIVDLNSLVQQSVKLSQPKWKDQALANGVAIEINTELDAVPPVAGHESELREVLTNLVFNAVDAMPKSGSITLRTKADGDHVRLEVSDTGTGMSEEVRQRCLEPFFSTKGEKGSGLGLAMVYGIIKRLRGTIEITSAVGVGTTFSIRLPIQAEQATTQTPEGHNLDGVRLQVLVVDDDPLVGRVTGEYLRVAGHHVEVVASAAEAVKRFNPERVDLVVTDHGMPHMTGRQLAEVIKQVSPSTPVVLLTGGDEMEAAETTSVAVDAELSKPLTMAALQRTLSTLTFHGSLRAESRKEIGDAA